MYSFDSTIRYSETDAQGLLKYFNICNYFQDCSIFHSESVGTGVQRLLKERRAWLLARWQIGIIRRPAFGEKVKVSTWPSSFHKCIGTRNFLMETLSGEMLAWADSDWAYVDVEGGRPVRAEGPLVEVYVPEAPLSGVEYDRSRIQAEGEGRIYPPFAAQDSHMDTNGHMNNSQYIYLAQQYIPAGLKISGIRVEYKHAVVLQDRITPVVSCQKTEAGERYVVAFRSVEERNYALIEFTGIRDKENGETQ